MLHLHFKSGLFYACNLFFCILFSICVFPLHFRVRFQMLHRNSVQFCWLCSFSFWLVYLSECLFMSSCSNLQFWRTKPQSLKLFHLGFIEYYWGNAANAHNYIDSFLKNVPIDPIEMDFIRLKANSQPLIDGFLIFTTFCYQKSRQNSGMRSFLVFFELTELVLLIGKFHNFWNPALAWQHPNVLSHIREKPKQHFGLCEPFVSWHRLFRYAEIVASKFQLNSFSVMCINYWKHKIQPNAWTKYESQPV